MRLLIDKGNIIKDLHSGLDDNDWTTRSIHNDISIYVKEVQTEVSHYHEYVYDGNICFIFGSVYGISDKNIVKQLHDLYLDKGCNGISSVDGDFIFAYFNRVKAELTVISDREGMIPLYYRQFDDRIIITTDAWGMFFDYCQDDIDYSSLYDFLRYGTLIGDNTFSKRVRLLQGGCIMRFQNEIKISTYHVFFHDSENAEYDCNKLFEELSVTYMKAVKKRIDRPIDKCAVFLSGGMDSRLVLATFNKLFEQEKVECYSFGQVFSEEVDVAEKAANLYGNKFNHIMLYPEDFIKRMQEYSKYSAGSDMVVQSYIIGASEIIPKSCFFTGSYLECHLGGTFTNEVAINCSMKFSDFIIDNTNITKMHLMSNDDLKYLCKDGVYERLFQNNTDNLRKEAEKYDHYKIKDAIQSFGINNRDKRLVTNREIIPARQMDYINPNFDRYFLDAASKIPAESRIGRKFYREMFMHYAPEYADILYNNTTLPVSAPLELWGIGSKIEYERELLWEQVLIKENKNGKSNCMYYPHFYSDFNGYSRYDKNWAEMFEEYLLNERSFIIRNLFNADTIRQLLTEHLAYTKNRRKELIYLTSIEVFFRQFLKDKCF